MVTVFCGNFHQGRHQSVLKSTRYAQFIDHLDTADNWLHLLFAQREIFKQFNTNRVCVKTVNHQICNFNKWFKIQSSFPLTKPTTSMILWNPFHRPIKLGVSSITRVQPQRISWPWWTRWPRRSSIVIIIPTPTK